MHSFIPYAVRLGYSEETALLALERLGRNATLSELLTLVISLRSATSARENDYRHSTGVKLQKKPKRRCLGYKTSTLSYSSVHLLG